VRYQGTLVDADKSKKTMTLKNVKNFGSEGRRNGVNEVPSSDSILGMVKFKVELIRDFTIVKQEQTEEQDPAIIESTVEDNEEKKEDKGPW
jgi:protein LSM14